MKSLATLLFGIGVVAVIALIIGDAVNRSLIHSAQALGLH